MSSRGSKRSGSVHPGSTPEPRRIHVISQIVMMRFSLIFPCGKSSYHLVKLPGQILNPGAVRSNRTGGHLIARGQVIGVQQDDDSE